MKKEVCRDYVHKATRSIRVVVYTTLCPINTNYGGGGEGGGLYKSGLTTQYDLASLIVFTINGKTDTETFY